MAHQEQDLLDAFRQLTDEERAEILEFAMAAAAFDQVARSHIMAAATDRPQ